MNEIDLALTYNLVSLDRIAAGQPVPRFQDELQKIVAVRSFEVFVGDMVATAKVLEADIAEVEAALKHFAVVEREQRVFSLS